MAPNGISECGDVRLIMTLSGWWPNFPATSRSGLKGYSPASIGTPTFAQDVNKKPFRGPKGF
jgi:hypothetical protein